MRNEEQLYQKYTDILDRQADPELLHLVSDLDAYADNTSLPGRLLEPTEGMLRQRFVERNGQGNQPAGHFWQSSQPQRGLAVVATCLLALFILGGAAYYATPVIEQAFGLAQDPGTQQIYSRKLGKDIEQSRTMNGFTITLKRVYASTNKIVIGYTVTGPEGRSFANFNLAPGDQAPVLTDSHGRRYHLKIIPVSPGAQNDQGAALLVYEGLGKHENARRMKLHLSFSNLLVVERTGKNGTLSHVVKGPWSFDFTLPVE